MNTIFLVTAGTPAVLKAVEQWFRNKVNNVYLGVDGIGMIPDLPVAVLLDQAVVDAARPDPDGLAKILATLAKLSSAEVVHIHAGVEDDPVFSDFEPSSSWLHHHHVKTAHRFNPDAVAFLVAMDEVWRAERDRKKPHDRPVAHVPLPSA